MTNDNTARDTDKLRARQMSACIERENNAIYFLSDARRHKDGEFRDSPGSVISCVKMAAAAVTGTRPGLGDNRKAAL